MKREQWKSKIGFMWAAIGSAVGLGSIWRFPYVVGDSGGGAFVLLFIFCLIAISIPVFMAEVAIGRQTHTSPSGAFYTLGKSKWWRAGGRLTILTGFIVSSFYSVIAGLTLGYFVQALLGNITHFQNATQVASFYEKMSGSVFTSLSWHATFMVLAGAILYYGIQKGIESWNKVLMPLLMVILVMLAVKGLSLKGGRAAFEFLFKPDFSAITPAVAIMALGQAFFGLSLGQGTMVTYGSYLTRKENIPHICLPIVSSVVIVSLLAGISIFSIVFSADMAPSEGPTLMFKSLPLIFSGMQGGYLFACLFFLLIFLAGLTSQISAMQPSIAYLCDEKGLSRRRSVILVTLGAFLLGVPSALSTGVLKDFLFHRSFFDLICDLSINVLIPFGGLIAVILVGWRWGIKKGIEHLEIGAESLFKKHPLIMKRYLKLSICYLAPIIIIMILLNLVGLI